MPPIAIALLLTAVFAVCCSDEDASADVVPGPKPVLVTTHIENGLSQTRTLTYDAKGRLATLSKSGETVTFSYDGQNLVRRVESATKNYYLNYDSDGKFEEFINATDNEFVSFTHLGNNDYIMEGSFIAFHQNGDWRKLGDYAFGYTEAKGAFANVPHLNVLAVVLADEDALRYCALKRRQTYTFEGISIGYECDDDPAELPLSETLDQTTYSYQYD